MILDLASPSSGDTAAQARDAAESFIGRLKSYAREAGQTLEGAADTVGSSVEDFIARNPDLHQRVRKLGRRLDIPGMDKAEAQVSLSVRRGTPGTPVTMSAIACRPTSVSRSLAARPTANTRSSKRRAPAPRARCR